MSHIEKRTLFIIIIIHTCCLLFLNNLNVVHNSDITEDQLFSIQPVLASSDYSSFHPWVFHSGSGRLQLLFLHEILEYDITIYDYYHTYELEDGRWALPQKIDQVPLIYDVKPTKNGFDIYYGQNIQYHNSRLGYSESYLFAGIFKMHYNEQLNKWSEPVELFGESHIRDFLKLSSQQIHGYLHSFFLQEDESVLLVWSFEFYGEDETLTHKYVKTYILSEIDTSGVIESHSISGLEEYRNNGYVRIVEQDDSFCLYASSYTKKAILFPNGTCSYWQDVLIAKDMASTFPLTTFADHRVQQDWEVSEGQTISVIDNRYLVYHPYGVGWQILDLARETLTANSFISPYSIEPTGENRTFDFVMNLSSTLPEVYLTPIFTDNTIELWEFNSETTNWNQISLLDYSPTPHFDLLGESPIVELIVEENSWRIFWAQKVRDGPTPLHEIFTVTYNSTTAEWGVVTQITDTGTITDDKFIQEPIPGFLFAFSIIGLTITVLFIRKEKNQLNQRQR